MTLHAPDPAGGVAGGAAALPLAAAFWIHAAVIVLIGLAAGLVGARAFGLEGKAEGRPVVHDLGEQSRHVFSFVVAPQLTSG